MVDYLRIDIQRRQSFRKFMGFLVLQPYAQDLETKHTSILLVLFAWGKVDHLFRGWSVVRYEEAFLLHVQLVQWSGASSINHTLQGMNIPADHKVSPVQY